MKKNTHSHTNENLKTSKHTEYMISFITFNARNERQRQCYLMGALIKNYRHISQSVCERARARAMSTPFQADR